MNVWWRGRERALAHPQRAHSNEFFHMASSVKSTHTHIRLIVEWGSREEAFISIWCSCDPFLSLSSLSYSNTSLSLTLWSKSKARALSRLNEHSFFRIYRRCSVLSNGLISCFFYHPLNSTNQSKSDFLFASLATRSEKVRCMNRSKEECVHMLILLFFFKQKVHTKSAVRCQIKIYYLVCVLRFYVTATEFQLHKIWIF